MSSSPLSDTTVVTLSTVTSILSSTKVLRTRNDIIPFLTELNILDDRQKEIMDEYDELTKNATEKHLKIQKHQNTLKDKIDQKFEIEESPESPEKTKNLRNRKVNTLNELIISLNLQIDNFDIVGKRALPIIDMINLFNEYHIPIVDKLNLMMSNVSLSQ